jgi:uncharacterized delta-60 repeat protein
VITNVNPGADMFINSIAIDGQNRIVAAGYEGNQIAVARYLPNGTLDTSFGGSGIVTTSFGTSTQDIGYSVAIDSSGRIVVAGTTDNHSSTDEAVARYQSNGQLDPSFGSGGKAVVSIGTPTEVVHPVAMAIDASGNIVLATNAYHSTWYSDFGVIRLTPGGQLDTSFGGGTGKVITALGSSYHDYDQVSAVAIDAGHILVGGEYENDGDTGDNLTLLRYNGNGALDSSFGAGGVESIAGPLNATFNAVAVDSQGRIYAAEYGTLARFTQGGTLDSAFGSGGITNASAPPYPASIALDSNGRILVAGQTVSGGQTDQVSLARYQANGALDTSFGNGGSVTTDIGPSNYSFADSVALDSQGRIVIGGGSYDLHTGLNSFALARYLGDPAQAAAETLSVTKTGGGLGTVTSSPAGIDCGPICSAGFAQGTHVTLTASPTSPSTFAGWSGACSGIGTCTVTLSSAQNVTATFLRATNPLVLGKVKLNKGRGTASIATTVSQPGVIVVAGSGIRRWTGHVSGASTIHVTVQLTKKLAHKLKRTGRVTVRVTITFTPRDGGQPVSVSQRITLIRRRH